MFCDDRGWFSETFNKETLKELGIDIDFIQDNHSLSAQKGTLRGLHLQTNPKAQMKLVRCTRGSILDVAVDLRKGSPTYTYDLSYAIYELMLSGDYGIHHITNDGFCSWNELAREIFKMENKQVIVEQILTKDYPTTAKRPLNSKMTKDKYTLRHWKEALAHFLGELEND